MVLRLVTGLVALAALGAWCAPSWAAGYATDASGRLYRILPKEQTGKLVGQVQITAGEGQAYVPTLTDIALSPEKGMYGISFSTLYKIDVTDPTKSTRVGDFGLVSLNACCFDEAHVLWAAGGSALYRIDLETGKATLVGAFGQTWTSDGDLAVVGDKLYGTVRGLGASLLVELDRETGKATQVGAIRDESGPLLDVWGLIWDGQTLFALTQGGQIAAVDPRAGTATRRFVVEGTFWGACPEIRL